MEKFAKYYLSSEGVVLLGILLSGLYDPSFWLWGVLFIGIALTVIGLIVSIIWYLVRAKFNRKLATPFLFVISHIVALALMFYFINFIFSAGIHFWM